MYLLSCAEPHISHYKSSKSGLRRGHQRVRLLLSTTTSSSSESHAARDRCTMYAKIEPANVSVEAVGSQCVRRGITWRATELVEIITFGGRSPKVPHMCYFVRMLSCLVARHAQRLSVQSKIKVTTQLSARCGSAESVAVSRSLSTGQVELQDEKKQHLHTTIVRVAPSLRCQGAAAITTWLGSSEARRRLSTRWLAAAPPASGAYAGRPHAVEVCELMISPMMRP